MESNLKLSDWLLRNLKYEFVGISNNNDVLNVGSILEDSSLKPYLDDNDILDSNFRVGYYAYCAYTECSHTSNTNFSNYSDYGAYALYNQYSKYTLYSLYTLYTNYTIYTCTSCQICNTCQGKCESKQNVNQYIEKYVREEQVNLAEDKKVINIAPEFDTPYTWSAGTLDTTHTLYNNKALKLTSIVDSNETTSTCTSDAFNQIQGHIYYARVYEYHTDSNLNSCSFELYWPIAEPRLGIGYFGPANQWNMLSMRNSRTNWSSGKQSLRIDFNNGGKAGSVWYDGLMLVDLTADFGAGQEPTKEWCDTNIPYHKAVSAQEWNDVVNWLKAGVPYNTPQTASDLNNVSVGNQASAANDGIKVVDTLKNKLVNANPGITISQNKQLLDSDLIAIGVAMNKAKISNTISCCQSSGGQSCVNCQDRCQSCQDFCQWCQSTERCSM